MPDLSAETKIAHIQPAKIMDIFSSLCGRLLGDIKNERVLRERTLIDFCKTATWIISDGAEKLPESFNALADRISVYWLYETDRETDEERKYSYIRLYQTVCVLRVFLSERKLEDKAFSAVEKNRSNSKMIELVGKDPGITCQRLLEDLALSQEELLMRTDALRRDGFLSIRRSGSEQYYFLTNSGEILGQFLSGRYEKHFLQEHWSHDRVTVFTALLQVINKSNISFNLRQIIKGIDSLNEEVIKATAWRLDHSTHMPSTVNTIPIEYIFLPQKPALTPPEESWNWFEHDIKSDEVLNRKYMSVTASSIERPIEENISLPLNGSNLYE